MLGRPLGPVAPRMAVERVLAQGRQLLDQLGAPLPRERRGDADVVERALVVVQPEQQRADVRARPVLVPAEAGDHAVGGALVLDLEHRPLAGLVRRVEPLGDDAVEPGALEPLEPVRRRWRDRAWPGSGGPAAWPRRGRPRAVRGARPAGTARRSSSPSASRSHATKLAGDCLGEHPDPRGGRVDAQQERLEVERAVTRDDDLAVEHAALRERRPQRRGQLREVAVERLEVARLRVDLVAVAEDEGAEAVPLGLEQPAVVARQRIGRPWRASARSGGRRGVPSPRTIPPRIDVTTGNRDVTWRVSAVPPRPDRPTAATEVHPCAPSVPSFP